MPSPGPILKIHHAQITVAASDLEAARSFYRDVLGMEEIPKPGSLQSRGGLWLQAGEHQLHIGIEEDVNRHATKAHIAYEVADLARWKTHLERAGVKILDSVPIPGYARFEFRDPFGNRVELIQPQQ
jgi:catechol 2,3-dioxygenase-like lactoylglutathione lyase family enzyme